MHVIISGGSAGITASNPGLVKILGGLVFPVGLVMYVSLVPRFEFQLSSRCDRRCRIVLQGQELLTSNMMVSFSRPNRVDVAHRIHPVHQTVPMLMVKRAAPWHTYPLNWIIGTLHYRYICRPVV